MAEKKSNTKKVNLYNAHDGLTGRDGGPYMDQEDAKNAEILRAKVEGRKPNLDNPPAIAGTVLITEGQLISGGGNIPASKQNGYSSYEDGVKAKPVATVSVPNK